MLKDSGLVEKLRKGDRKAAKKLFEMYSDKLFRFLMQFNAGRVAAEEAVQNAFIKAFGRINQFEENSSFSTWLFRIGVNEMKTELNKMNRHVFLVYDELPDSTLQTEDKQFDFSHDMKSIIDELDENKKAVLLLYDVEGYSHEEISEILGISVLASRSLLSRTRKQLREKLESEGVYR